MKKSRLGLLGMVLGTVWFAASPVHAAQKKHVKKKPEIYSAVEDEGEGEAPAHAAVVASASVASSPRSVAAVPAIEQPLASPSFDIVPSDQADPLAKRLQLVEILIRKYHRAYDYRVLTVRQLEAILAQLDAATTASQPAESGEGA